MAEDSRQLHNTIFTTVQGLAGVACDRMANRTVAYLNYQILVGGSLLERRVRCTLSNIWWPLPTRRSVPNMNTLGSAVFEILPVIAKICVLGAQFIQFSYTIGLSLVYSTLLTL